LAKHIDYKKQKEANSRLVAFLLQSVNQVYQDRNE